jgi:hypothetical protein
MMFQSEAKAQYNYFGGGWIFNTYTHRMTFTGVKGSDLKDPAIVFFVSDTVWYDNIASCCVGKNCVNEPISHVTMSASVTPKLDALCERRGKCTGEVKYPNSVADLENSPDLLEDCRAVVGDPDASPQLCFNLLFFDKPEGGHCRNKNDLVVAVRTKGVCTTVTPFTCTDAIKPDTCTQENDPVGVRYTFPSFNQKPGDSFVQERDDSCIACVNNQGQCNPQP